MLLSYLMFTIDSNRIYLQIHKTLCLPSYVAGMSYEKLFDMCRIFEFSKYYFVFILRFFLTYKTETASRAETEGRDKAETAA